MHINDKLVVCLYYALIHVKYSSYTAVMKHILLQKNEKKKKYSVSTEKGENIANVSRYCLLDYIQTEYISHLITAISSFELQLCP